MAPTRFGSTRDRRTTAPMPLAHPDPPLNGPAAPAAPDPDGDSLRPRWRGLIHRYAAALAVPAFLILVILAPTAGDRLAVAIYGAGVTTMLTVSAIYHSGRLSPAGLQVLKRLDHSTILLAIGGSYTAVTALSLTGTARTVMLAIVWTATIVGIVIRMSWLNAPYPVVAIVYLVVGWIALVDLPAYVAALSTYQLTMIVVGGLFYTVGGVVYAVHKPNPIPEVFGYHEVFHALVVAGAVSHYVAVLSLVLDARQLVG
jgi:hemolysin III